MILQMSQGSAGVQTLPAHDNSVTTGPMGDCVSVIILYDLIDDSYQNVKGQHGLGGAENIHFPTLFAGAVNNIATQIVIIPGSLQQSEYARNNIMEIVDNARTAAGLGNAVIRMIANMSNAVVNRQAQVSIPN